MLLTQRQLLQPQLRERRGGSCAPRGRVRLVARCGPPSAPVNKGFSLLEWSNKVLPQGQLVGGVKEGWRLAWAAMMREMAPQSRDGAYQRPQYAFGGKIGDPAFPAEAGRYHLYLGNACPWCHRVAIAAVLRGHFRPASFTSGSSSAPANGDPKAGAKAGPGGGLAVSYTRLEDDPTRARRGGWVLSAADPDPLFGAADLWQVYDTLQPGFRGRCTAPFLVDRAVRAAVCNESADIVRSMDGLHGPWATDVVLRPPGLEAQIDDLNARIYSAINNGVYRSGFATTQAAYDAVQAELWSALDEMEARLQKSRFLLGDKITESDVWLLPTVSRLDAMYGPLFKCGRRRVFAGRDGAGGDYPALAGWVRDMWGVEVPGSAVQIRDTLDLDAARRSYHTSLFPLNPGGIVAAGPTAADLRLDAASGRGGGGLEEVCHSRGSGR
ncbi:hypothetical protein HYH03_008663 [Edaphochlamys debaryana]|uniref:Glutathione S-transferase n=1 Tax=Edaphochlamys debaryana TaxID=47281 RepID=A0A836BZ56_9CHLO|nr:hypothetical protein HYH03_008663 [Edaphochlamys debaryana]|eukprot:KAG2492999.1 hypothetical protein HYH03_008663 [Edaphochlamys debaryana]